MVAVAPDQVRASPCGPVTVVEDLRDGLWRCREWHHGTLEIHTYPEASIASWPLVVGDHFVDAMPVVEKVDHPSHYGGADDPFEPIKVIEAWALGFCLGNAVKYIARAGRKPGESELDDLRKARWYLDRQIQRIERDR